VRTRQIGIEVTYQGYDSVKEDAITRALGKYHMGGGTMLDSGERDHTGVVHPRAFPRVWGELKAIRGVNVRRIEPTVYVPLTAREIVKIRRALGRAGAQLADKLASWAKEIRQEG
jgi:hypothetical protein